MAETNDINALRGELFATLRDLRAGKIDTTQAKAIGDVAQVIINSAKVESDYMKHTGTKINSGFIKADEDLPPGIVGRRVHRIKG